MTLHRISGIKVNARARQNDTVDNRQWAKWHTNVRALSQMARLIKDSAFVFTTRLTQSRVFGQTKKCAEFRKTKKPCEVAQWRVKWHASKMTRQAKCLAGRVYLLIMKSGIEAKYCCSLATKYKPCTFIWQRFSIINQQKWGREWLFIPYLLWNVDLSIKRNLTARRFATMQHMMHSDSYKTKFDVFNLME